MNRPPSSGPSTVVTPNTAPSAPWYLPRSRSGMTSAISAVAVTARPPAPRPCTARQAISQVMLPANPQNADAPTNRPAETWKTSLRLNRSPNLPASTVDTVSASRYDDTTHDRWLAPPRSPTIVGSAVDTIVWSSAESNMPSSTVQNTRFICRRLICRVGPARRASLATVMAPSPSGCVERAAVSGRYCVVTRGGEIVSTMSSMTEGTRPSAFGMIPACRCPIQKTSSTMGEVSHSCAIDPLYWCRFRIWQAS